MKLLFLTNVPSPYRVDFFNELGKLCDLTVVFEKRTSTERDTSWQNYKFENFKGVFLKGISVRTDAALCFGVTKYVSDKSFDKIICSNFSSPTGMIAISCMRRKKIDYYLECDGATAKSGKGIKEWIKTHFIKGAAGYYSTGKSADNYYITYGAPKDKIYRYPFTSLKAGDILDAPVSPEEKRELREKLGIKEDKVIITVGRFSYNGGYGKGYDLILKAASQLSSAGIYIIGGDPTPEFAQMKDDLSAQNVTFLPHKSKDELAEYYKAADVFALMTRGEAWGLVVNEAMAKGLPVITTDKCVAGLELITDGVNGFLVNSEDYETFADRANKLLTDGNLRSSIAEKALAKIREYTIEEMARRHI